MQENRFSCKPGDFDYYCCINHFGLLMILWIGNLQRFCLLLPTGGGGCLSSRYNLMSAWAVDILNILKLKGGGHPRWTAGDSAGSADWSVYTGPFQYGDLRQLNFVNYSWFFPRNKAKTAWPIVT